MTIKDMKIGEIGIIEKICGSDSLKLKFLDMGFIPETIIKIKKIALIFYVIKNH